jgi:hypothetical protein
LADGFRHLIQLFTICQQRDEFDGAEKLHDVRIWTAYPFIEEIVEGFLSNSTKGFAQFSLSQFALSRTPHRNGMDLDGSSKMKTKNVTRISTFCLVPPPSTQ